MPAAATKQAYSREEVQRLLGVSERQLRSWEKQHFLEAADFFDFLDLLALRTLAGLRESKIPPSEMRRALAAIRARFGSGAHALTDVRIYSQGKKVHVQFAGRKMEPVSGQLLLDFDEAEIKKLLSFPVKPAHEAGAAGHQRKRKQAEQWFEKGLELEQVGAPLEEVIAAYKKASEIDPASAGALVNLGTVYFNLRSWRESEQAYRTAIEVDPTYALAHYNLANLFDERGEKSKALAHYQAALKIHPNYIDAHYNIALVYQALNQPLKAVQHWKIYLKLDPASSWAAIARRELERARDSTIVRGTGPRAIP